MSEVERLALCILTNAGEEPKAMTTPSPQGKFVRHSDHLAEIERLQADLAECYRLTGADPDGDSDAMLAKDAVEEVRRLRSEHDTALLRLDGADTMRVNLLARAEQAEQALPAELEKLAEEIERRGVVGEGYASSLRERATELRGSGQEGEG